jgi:protein-S-isoprenylcysteine O-methyltransferase Ste14
MMRSMPTYLYLVLAAGWLIWLTPFVLSQRRTQRPARLDRRARWGIALQGVAYALLWQGKFWLRSPAVWQITLSMIFLVAAALFSWTGARALGKQWRLDAGLNADHELVRSGPYRVVRHPIYTSMLCMLLGTGLIITPLWLLLIAIIVFLIGTEIRVRLEDGLLAFRFGTKFAEYKRTVPAYIPFL